MPKRLEGTLGESFLEYALDHSRPLANIQSLFRHCGSVFVTAHAVTAECTCQSRRFLVLLSCLKRELVEMGFYYVDHEVVGSFVFNRQSSFAYDLRSITVSMDAMRAKRGTNRRETLQKSMNERSSDFVIGFMKSSKASVVRLVT